MANDIKVETESEEDEELELTPEDEETTDWKARAKELERKAILQRAKTKELKLKLAETEAKPPEKVDNTKSDYAKLAYLEAKGISEEDYDYIFDEVKATGKDLKDVVSFKYVKEELKNRKESREAKDALPTGSKRSSAASRDNVEYHLANKTKLSEINDVTLRRKVLNAREESSKTSIKFGGRS